MKFFTSTLLAAVALLGAPGAIAAASVASDLDALHHSIDKLADQVEPHVIANRRHLHQHPELSNRETQTAAYIAEHLQALGIEVQTGIAKTGVVGILKGGQPGPVIGLRAGVWLSACVRRRNRIGNSEIREGTKH